MNDSARQVMDKVIAAAAKRMKSRNAVARRLGITPQAMAMWQHIPPKHCLALEEMSGVSRHEQRPDIYGPAPSDCGKSKRKPRADARTTAAA